MKNYFLILLIFLIISNCTLKKVVKKHGVRNLEIKKDELIINKSNLNDIKNILGPPSSKSTFDNDLYFFIEREITNKSILKLGQRKLLTNNVLILELDNRGILVKKDFYNINKMNDIDFSKLDTEQKYTKRSFVYDFLSSMRQKINDPLGKRKKP
jgi:outer membrane protein assembly factor BamE (lipoprotein component of BamABCDE complex)